MFIPPTEAGLEEEADRDVGCLRVYGKGRKQANNSGVSVPVFGGRRKSKFSKDREKLQASCT